MSGKPGKAKPSSPEPRPAAQKKASPAQEKATPAPADDPDDPFGVSAPVMSKAVPLLPKPVKGKLHRIVCPMCETPGFQSKKAAGREVRCANKECMVPVFTAPPLEGESEEAPRAEVEEKKSAGPLLLYGGVTAVMLIIGGIVWFLNRPPSTAGLDAPYVPPIVTTDGNSPVTDESLTPGSSAEEDKPDTPPQPPPAPSAEELQAEAIELMNRISLIRDRNSRKPYCRRMTAEAHALAGDFQGVDTQLRQLEIVGPTLKFYGIPPLVEAGWQHLAAGRTEELNAVLARIEQPLETLPEYGTVAVTTTVEYATLLAAAEQSDRAVALLRQRRNVRELGQFVETWLRSLVGPGLSFEAALEQRPATGWSEPQWAAVAFGLSCRGYGSPALEWAQRAPTERAVTECLAAWAEGQLLSGSANALTAIRQQISKLSPAARAFVLARTGVIQSSISGQPAEAPLLQQAADELNKAGTPGTVAMPNLKTQTEVELPDAAPLTAAAIAAAEIAHAQQLSGQPDAAWSFVTVAQDWARALAPSPVQTREPFDEIDRLGPSRVQALLKVSLNLLTDNDARNAYQDYRSRIRRLDDAATARFALQQKIMAEAVDWGLAERVWEEIRTRAAPDTEPARAEPWFDTRLPARLHAHFRANGQDALQSAVEQTVTAERLRSNSDVGTPTALVAAEQIDSGKISAAARRLEAFAAANREDRDQRFQQETALQLASRLVSSGQIAQAITFAQAFEKSPQLREEMFQTIGAEATTLGQPMSVLVPARGEELAPPERIALLRGLVGAVHESTR